MLPTTEAHFGDASARQPWTDRMRATSEPLRLYNLRLPFSLRLTARRGRHRLASSRRSGILQEGASICLPAYQTLHYHGATVIDARVGHELHLIIQDEPEPPTFSFCSAESRRSPDGACVNLTTWFARAVFHDPAGAWSRVDGAERAGVSPRQFAGQLFREGSAFSTIVREQRLMRALLLLLAQKDTTVDLTHLAERVGFASRRRLDTAFFNHFGCSLAQVARLAWCPAFTWSTARVPGIADRSLWPVPMSSPRYVDATTSHQELNPCQ